MHSFEEQQRHARLQAFINFKVKHPRLEEMDDTLMQTIYGHRTYTLLPIYGAGGVGKSTVLKHVAESCRATETDLSCVPVVEVQASPEDIGASARLDFYRQILTQLRVSRPMQLRVGRKLVPLIKNILKNTLLETPTSERQLTVR